MGKGRRTGMTNKVVWEHGEVGLPVHDDFVDYIDAGVAWNAVIQVTIASSATNDMLFIVPAGAAVYLDAHAQSSLPSLVDAYEGSTVTDNGTEVKPVSYNREDPTTPGELVYHTATVTVLGTKLWTHQILAASNPTQAGGGSEAGKEWLLGPGTYHIRFTNQAAQNNKVELQLDWHDEYPP